MNLSNLVGMQGIEPCASCSQSKHATDAPHPVFLLHNNNLDVCLFLVKKKYYFIMWMSYFNLNKYDFKEIDKNYKVIFIILHIQR
jgi:hypothetical protein